MYAALSFLSLSITPRVSQSTHTYTWDTHYLANVNTWKMPNYTIQDRVIRRRSAKDYPIRRDDFAEWNETTIKNNHRQKSSDKSQREKQNDFLGSIQKWHLQKSASDDGVKIELRPVLAQFKANLSFPDVIMRLAGL